MQFARELSKGFGDKGANKSFGRKPEGGFSDRNRSESGRSSAPRSSAPRSNAARSDAPRVATGAATGEKFGNPRPRNAQTSGDSAPRRPRSFA